MTAAAFFPPFLIGLLLGALAAVLYYARRNSALAEDAAALRAEKAALEVLIDQQQQGTAALEQKFALQFENLASKLFDEKTKNLKESNQESLTQLLSPLREGLQRFQLKMEESAKEQFSLKNEIKNIVSLHERMRVETESLTKALRGDVKTQGNWGEIMLEKILEESGLRSGEDYTLQGSGMGMTHVEGGQRLKPDVIVNLPEGKHIIIDAKVSLTAYERFAAASDKAEQDKAGAEFLTSVRAHIKGLAERRYQDVPGLGTPDFVLMFMPIEGAYALAHQQDANLHAFAWEKRIVLVGPSTLFATLRTISSVWRLERQNRNSEEIARQGGALYDKFVSFVEDMSKIGERLGQTQKAHDEALKKLTSGAGNLVRRAELLRALGVKTAKSLPRDLTEDAADQDTDTTLRQLGS